MTAGNKIYCFGQGNTNPYINIATEEYLLKNSTDNWLMLYVNAPSVIIGKHQVAHREANTLYVNTYQLPVVRRITGGGTVYHDEGNLNFAFITNMQNSAHHTVRANTRHIIDFLSQNGIDARMEPDGSLRNNDRKVSGSAEYIYRNRLLHHGTLLYSTNIDNMHRALRNNTSTYRTKAVTSKPAPVANLHRVFYDISEHWYLCNVWYLRNKLLQHIVHSIPRTVQLRTLPSHFTSDIDILAATKYTQWEWNHAYGPSYSLTKTVRYKSKDISFNLTIAGGIITDVSTDNTFTLSRLAKRLVNIRHIPHAVQRILAADSKTAHISPYNFF